VAEVFGKWKHRIGEEMKEILSEYYTLNFLKNGRNSLNQSVEDDSGIPLVLFVLVMSNNI